MLGLKNLSMNKLSTAFMVVSAAMVLFGLALTPTDSAPVTVFVIWIAGALMLIGLWIAIAIEVFKRFLGSGDRQESEG